MNFAENIGSGGSFVLLVITIYVFYRIIKKCIELDDN